MCNVDTQIFLAGQTLEKLCSPAIWAEGPAWIEHQACVIFSDVKGNRMFRWSESQGVSVFRAESDYANGNAVDAQGRLVTCEHGRRGISRTELDGQRHLLVDRVEGKRFNSPNDVVVRADGTIWFTDPPYGIVSNEEGYKSESQVIGCYVYCFDPKSGHTTIVISDTQRPNGLAFSPDENWLYVADMSVVDFPQQGRRELRAYRIDGLTAVFSHRLAEVAPGIPDGFCVDKHGNVFCSCEDGVLIFSAEGQLLGKIAVPERVSNCTFGGSSADELYITATTSLYRIKLATQGIQRSF